MIPYLMVLLTVLVPGFILGFSLAFAVDRIKFGKGSKS